jgi:hypothetical protein
MGQFRKGLNGIDSGQADEDAHGDDNDETQRYFDVDRHNALTSLGLNTPFSQNYSGLGRAQKNLTNNNKKTYLGKYSSSASPRQPGLSPGPRAE